VFGVHAVGDQHVAVSPRYGESHQDGLGDRAAAVVQAGIGYIHAAELANERLVLEKRLQATLARFGLIRSVGSVELAAASGGRHHGRDKMIVATAAQEADRIVSRPVPP